MAPIRSVAVIKTDENFVNYTDEPRRGLKEEKQL
jgi:hypothetical protein